MTGTWSWTIRWASPYAGLLLAGSPVEAAASRAASNAASLQPPGVAGAAGLQQQAQEVVGMRIVRAPAEAYHIWGVSVSSAIGVLVEGHVLRGSR